MDSCATGRQASRRRTLWRRMRRGISGRKFAVKSQYRREIEIDGWGSGLGTGRINPIWQVPWLCYPITLSRVSDDCWSAGNKAWIRLKLVQRICAKVQGHESLLTAQNSREYLVLGITSHFLSEPWPPSTLSSPIPRWGAEAAEISVFLCGEPRAVERKHGLYVHRNQLIWDGEVVGSGIFISSTYSLHCHHQNDSALRWAII